MRTLIQTYRKFEIYFDTDDETFYTVSDEWDRQSTKKSFATIKKWIDDFLKENQEFKPFFVEPDMDSYKWQKGKIKIIGIRKEGRFIYEDGAGTKGQISEYDEKYYIMINEENDPIKNKISQLREESKIIQSRIKEYKSKMNVITLKDIKPDYLHNN